LPPAGCDNDDTRLIAGFVACPKRWELAMTENSVSTTPALPAEPQRRGFLAGLVAIVAGAFITLAPLTAGSMFALDPIRRKRAKYLGSDTDGFFAVTREAELPDDGSPIRFTIKADLVDAWNLFKDRTIGTVYLRKIPAAVNSVIAFTDVCPHLGCKITYQSSAHQYFCPCHASTFDLEGAKINKIPPRNMDELETKVINGEVWVKYQDFRGGIAEKTAT
jgi:menaquinol-cytochrome c reductase iron-sulfur subunit